MIFDVGNIGGGGLFVGPRPRRDEYDAWLDVLVDSKIGYVVSLLTSDDIERCELGDERRILESRGIEFVHYPIGDFGVPEIESFHKFITGLIPVLDGGGNLFVHCAGGIGRAGLVASCLLMRMNRLGADAAIRRVSKARGMGSPETSGQVRFVHEYESAYI